MHCIIVGDEQTRKHIYSIQNNVNHLCDQGIEVVKCSAWEDPLVKKILAVRKTELRVLWRSFVLGAFNVFLMTSIPAVVAVGTFAVYVATSSEPLTAQKAFTSVTLFGVLRLPLFQVCYPGTRQALNINSCVLNNHWIRIAFRSRTSKCILRSFILQNSVHVNTVQELMRKCFMYI